MMQKPKPHLVNVMLKLIYSIEATYIGYIMCFAEKKFAALNDSNYCY